MESAFLVKERSRGNGSCVGNPPSFPSLFLDFGSEGGELGRLCFIANALPYLSTIEPG